MSDDSLKFLSKIYNVLSNMERNGNRFESSFGGNINVEAMNSLSSSAQSINSSISGASEKMQSFNDSLLEATQRMRDQGIIFGTVSNSLSLMNKATGEIASSFLGMAGNTKIGKLFKAIKDTGSALVDWTVTLWKTKGLFKKLYVLVDGVASLIGGIIKKTKEMVIGLTSGVIAIGSEITKSIVGAIGSAITSFAKFSKFLFVLPLGIANRAADLGNQLRQELVEVIGQAVENTKEMFDMASNGGDAFKKLGGIAKGSLLSFQSVGSTMTKLFGYGAQGAANMVNSISKNISDMGLFADVFAKTTTNSVESIEFITRMTKGMAMQGDDINYVVREAMKNGENYRVTMTRMKEASDAASEEFGVNRKLLSKNFFQLRKDIINFGHMSEPALMSVAARATQMGVEIKDLAGVFNKFGTFEDAANSAALLSQTFGMNIDALQLIRAEDPMEIVEMFRNAMHATGRSFDDLNRHEKSLMATHTGMSVESLKTVMNYRTLGKSYEDIKKIMNDQKPEERQIRAMKDMRSSMSEIQKIMSKKDFFTAFLDGLSKTILYNTSLGKSFASISKKMEDFYENGLKFNKEQKKQLETIVGPFSKIFDEINEIFSIKSLEQIKANILKNLSEFFSEIISPDECLTDDATTLLSIKWRNKMESFLSLDFVLKSNSFFARIARVTGRIIGFILKSFVALGPGLVRGFGNAIKFLVKFILNPINTIKDLRNGKAIAKFLGLDEDCWEKLKKDAIFALEDIRSYLFGGKKKIAVGLVPTVAEKEEEGFFTSLKKMVKDAFDIKGDTSIIAGITTGIFNAIKNAWKSFKESNVGKSIIEGLESAWKEATKEGGWLRTSIGTIASAIMEGIASATDAIGSIVNAIMEAIQDYFANQDTILGRIFGRAKSGGKTDAAIQTAKEGYKVAQENLREIPYAGPVINKAMDIPKIPGKISETLGGSDDDAAAVARGFKGAHKSYKVGKAVRDAGSIPKALAKAGKDGLKATGKEVIKGVATGGTSTALKAVTKAPFISAALEAFEGMENKDEALQMLEKAVNEGKITNEQLKQALDEAQDAQNKQTLARTGGGVLASGLASMGLGAAMGTGVLPGPGTLAGGTIGFLGGVAAYYLGSEGAEMILGTETAQEAAERLIKAAEAKKAESAALRTEEPEKFANLNDEARRAFGTESADVDRLLGSLRKEVALATQEGVQNGFSNVKIAMDSTLVGTAISENPTAVGKITDSQLRTAQDRSRSVGTRTLSDTSGVNNASLAAT